MLLLLLSSLFVLINGVPVALQPELMELQQSNSTTKDPEGNPVVNPDAIVAKVNLDDLDSTNLKRGFDAKSLIEELVDADPAKVQEVITLVDIMLQEAQADLDRLLSESTDADNAYDIAVSNYDAAVASQVKGVADRLEAERLEAEAVATAQSAKDVAEGAKTGARDNLDAEKTRLESEITSLEQVIAILNGLSTGGGVTPIPTGTFGAGVGIPIDDFNGGMYGAGVSIPYGASTSSCSGCSSCAGGAVDKAGAKYIFHITEVAQYVVEVQWGRSSWNDKSYVQWNREPTVDDNLGIFGEESNNNKLETASTLLHLGDNILYIGSAPDGNYYTLPWCAISLRKL